MPRIEPLSRAKAPVEIQAVYDFVFSPGRDPVAEPGTASGSPGDFWTVLANVPDVIAQTMAFARDFMGSPMRELTEQQRELVIVRAGFNSESKFEYSQHRKALRAAGYPEDKASDIPVWSSSTRFSADERALLAFVDELTLGRGRCQDATFDRLREHFSDTAIIEAAYFAAQYVMFSLLIRGLRLEYDDLPERCQEVSG